MLKATDLRERTLEDLRELEKTLVHDVFQNRFKNFTNRLDDTSTIKKAKKDLARVKTILTERAKGLAPVANAEGRRRHRRAAATEEPEGEGEERPPPASRRQRRRGQPAAKAAKAAKPAAAKKTATKKTAKKSEAEQS